MPSKSTAKKSNWPAAMALVVLTLAAYAPAFNGGWVWDDDDYVYANVPLRTLQGLRDIWLRPLSIPQYYPLTHTTLWIEYQIAGLTPAVYHTTNILLHCTSVLLFFAILRRLRVPGAWFGAALFAIHPLGVESVAWIAERKNTLSMVFYLLSAMVWLRFYALDEAIDLPRRWQARLPRDRRWLYAVGLLLFIAALLSKSVTCTLPAAMLVLIWWKRGRIAWRDVLPMLPMFVLSAAMGSVTGYIEKHHVGAAGPDWAFTPLQRCFIAGGDIWFYVRKLAWPHPLMLVYPKWLIDPQTLRPWIAPAAAAAIVVGLWLVRSRIGRAPAAAAFLFIGGLFPALGFVDIYPIKFTFVQDHFAYHASLAIFAAAGAGLAYAGRLIGRPAMIGVVAAILITLGSLTFAQSRYYVDVLPYYAHSIEANPASPMPRLNYAKQLVLRRQQPEVAEAMLKQCSADMPGRSEPWDLLGMMFEMNQRYDDATAAYVQEEKIAPDDPRASYRIGHIAILQHRDADGEAALKHALSIQPSFEAANIELGQLKLAQRKPDEARTYFDAALATSPLSELAHRGLAMVAMAQNHLADAEMQATQSSLLEPNDPLPWNVLGVTRGARGDMAGARDAFGKLVQLLPQSAEAHFNYAIALANTGDAGGAAREKAIAQQLQASRSPRPAGQ